MPVLVELNNVTKYRFTAGKLKSIFEKTIGESNLGNLTDKEVEISVAFVEEAEIQQLNKQYRQKNKPTDVLSFAEYEQTGMIEKVQGAIFLGQLVVCPQYIEKSAVGRKIIFADELTYVLSHGLLHLLGYAHGKKMYAIQQAVVNKIIKKK